MSANTSTPRVMAIATTAGVGGVRPYDMFFNSSIPALVSSATHRDVDVKDHPQHSEFKVCSEKPRFLPWRSGNDEEPEYFHVSSGETTPN